MKHSNETQHSGQARELSILAALLVICTSLPDDAADAPSGRRGLSCE